MSLSSELATPGSVIHTFFKERVPATATFSRKAGQQLRGLRTIRPDNADKSYPYTLVGTAFDYRLRCYLGMESIFDTPAYRGFLFLRDFVGYDWLDVAEDFLWDADYWIRQLPAQQELDRTDEYKLSKICFVLGYLDFGLRGGPEQLPKELESLRRYPLEEDCLSFIDDQWVNDIGRLIKLASRNFVTNEVNRLAFGPTFLGSSYVNGADADLIMDSCLLDVKTTIRPTTNLAKNLRQLIGYTLLDWDDGYNLESAGFYFSRQGQLVAWPLEELLRQTTNDQSASLQELRDELRTRLGAGVESISLEELRDGWQTMSERLRDQTATWIGMSNRRAERRATGA